MTSATEDKWFDPKATTFGDRLAGARELSGMSQQALAKRLGVKDQTMEDWENDLSDPRANRMSMLAGILNVSLLWLLTGEGDGPGEPGIATSYVRDAGQLLDEIRSVAAQMQLASERLERVEEELENLVKSGDA